LKGSSETLTGLLDVAHFELNSKAIRKDYEAFVLSIGEFDERVFLDVSASSEIGTPSKWGSGPEQAGEFNDKISARRNLGPQLVSTLQDFFSSSPLTAVQDKLEWLY
jgi:hypothetical protein